jgi:hypothetical protein
MNPMPIICTDRGRHEARRIADYDPDSGDITGIAVDNFPGLATMRNQSLFNNRSRHTFPCRDCRRRVEVRRDRLPTIAWTLQAAGLDAIDISYEDRWPDSASLT